MNSSQRASAVVVTEAQAIRSLDSQSAEDASSIDVDQRQPIPKLHLPNGVVPVVGLPCLHLLNLVKVLLRTTPQVIAMTASEGLGQGDIFLYFIYLSL